LTDWSYIESRSSEQFCRIEYFGLRQACPKGEVDFVITVREFVQPPDPAMKFFAQADKQTNQKVVPFTPVGWGPTLGIALRECMEGIRRFPYEPVE
jgi:hypothetical protein